MKTILFVITITGILLSQERIGKTSVNYSFQSIITAQPNKGNELAKVMETASELISKIDGCKLYLVQQSIEEPTKIIVTEVWISKEAHQKSLENEAIIALIGSGRSLISDFKQTLTNFVSAHGI